MRTCEASADLKGITRKRKRPLNSVKISKHLWDQILKVSLTAVAVMEEVPFGQIVSLQRLVKHALWCLYMESHPRSGFIVVAMFVFTLTEKT